MCAEKLKETKEKNLIDWYNDVLLRSEMVDFSEVKGFAVYRPYGYAMWEITQTYLDAKFKSIGTQNTYFPLLIPEKLLTKEKNHVEGFAPEVAWVTMGGDRRLDERLAIRPTSETIMYDSYSKWVKSYRDLPLLLNQWNTMVRWETKETRFLLRGRENLWHEAHGAFSSKEDAGKNALAALDFYKSYVQDILAVPVIVGMKSETEKFAGAYRTYTVEAVLPNNFTSQAATSHDLGQNFSKAFDIKFLDENNSWQYVYQTSWGTSMRAIGVMVLVHGDNNGLILPPKIAPVQVVVIPILKGGKTDKEIKDYAQKILDKLSSLGVRVKLDDRETFSAGWKFNEYDMKGVPIKIDVGERELSSKTLFIRTRFNAEKYSIDLKDIDKVTSKLDEIQKNMFLKAKKDMESRITIEKDKDKFVSSLKDAKAVLKVAWCGEKECETGIKDSTGATSRVRPLDKEVLISEKCVFCGKKANFNTFFAQSY
ncbi:MAG: proline--tRNA ligase [Candidatus Parvarchaeota archaeon]|nr:proline--tRNA ligase [Candidatus Parvarchaeota archaeon]